MKRKANNQGGLFSSIGRAVDDNMQAAADLGSGKMTRPQFDSWYAKRREEGTGMIVALRERAVQMAEPLEAAIGLGKGLLKSPPPAPSGRGHARRRTRRAAARAMSRRAPRGRAK